MSDVSGMLMTRYDETKPQVWRVPLRDEIVPDVQVPAPRAYTADASLTASRFVRSRCPRSG
jgi:hypothetical protein